MTLDTYRTQVHRVKMDSYQITCALGSLTFRNNIISSIWGQCNSATAWSRKEAWFNVKIVWTLFVIMITLWLYELLCCRICCLEYDLVLIDFMQVKKKNRKTVEFWREVGQFVGGHSGEETERLMKNLQMEFQKLKQQLHVSGADTSTPPVLRNSSRLFDLYENYYQVFNPQGGSAVPAFVMTDVGVQQTPM